MTLSQGEKEKPSKQPRPQFTDPMHPTQGGNLDEIDWLYLLKNVLKHTRQQGQRGKIIFLKESFIVSPRPL